jgi:hypothetical protein
MNLGISRKKNTHQPCVSNCHDFSSLFFCPATLLVLTYIGDYLFVNKETTRGGFRTCSRFVEMKTNARFTC